MAGSSGGKTQNVKQSTEPWSGQEDVLKLIYSEAERAYRTMDKQVNPYGNFIGTDPLTAEAWATAEEIARQNQGMGDVARESATNLARNIRGTSAVTPEVMQAAIRPIQDNLMTQILPQINSQAIASGAYGGYRAGDLNLDAVDRFNRTAGDVTANIAYQDVARRDALEDQRTNQVVDLTRAAYAMDLMPQETLEAIGGQRRAMSQEELAAARSLFEEERMAPWIGLDQLVNLAGQGSGYSTTTGQTQTLGGMGKMGGALSGAMGGAMLGTTAGAAMGAGGGALVGAQAGSVVPGWGTLIGALLGAGLGYATA